MSCKKEGGTIDKPHPPLPPAVLLKEIIFPNLPSPYYHFEYDATNKAVVGAFAADLTRYNIVYDDRGRISEMRNAGFANRDTLRYFYDVQGRATAIYYFDATGRNYVKVHLTYIEQKLVRLVRERILGIDGFVVNKIMAFSYYEDGNLKEITDYRPAVNGQPEGTTVTKYEQYDDKINVDDFSLLHNDFFDNFLLLPGVRLQKNNPQKEILTAFESYIINYTYTYNDKNAPTNKRGDLLFTTGPNTGKRFEVNSVYSYY